MPGCYCSLPMIDLKTPAIAKKLYMDVATIDRLAQSVVQVMDIKAGFKICYIEEKGEDTVTIENVRFASRVLAYDLSEVGKVFP